MKSMDEAPRDGTEIAIRYADAWLRVSWLDCAWLRDGPDGDPDIEDCWRLTEDGETINRALLDIQADEPEGWLPADEVFSS